MRIPCEAERMYRAMWPPSRILFRRLVAWISKPIRCRNPYPLIAAAFAADRARVALHAVILKDDLALRIRIFNLIRPFPRVLTVRVESRCAWEAHHIVSICAILLYRFSV